ncbi:msbA [Symbiodinium natans]|uniref:MsbA protein n=1 Tax=Symbiodinium natans TaxID=878477 RepID=A0A812TU66_9DINO|nr:msbA [Symbiodinium natans]
MSELQDGSAVNGEKYVEGHPVFMGCNGVVTFGPGESIRTFQIQIINDDAFDTTLEFDVVLEDAENCLLDPRGSKCAVMILDDDVFPSNTYREVIMEHDEEALYEIGFGLLYSFMRFSFAHVPEIWWKTLLVLLLANLGNMYYFATIFLRVYLVDTVLNTEDPSTLDRLWIPGDRDGTAVALGLAWILPNFILLASDYFEMAVLEMGFNIRYHLRVNLFRKYLRYTPESRAKVPIQDLKISIMEDIPDLVADGYLIIFELWAMFGKIVMVGIFMARKHPRSAFPLFVYPILILIYLVRTYRRRLDLMAKEGEGQSATIGTLMHVNNAQKLIGCYNKRSFVVRRFEETLRNQRKYVMDLKFFNFWNQQLIPWITLLAIGTYIGLSSRLVLGGNTSLGSFLATINVYKDLGDRFSTILEGLECLSKAISPLAGLTMQFNLPIDIPERSEVYRRREEFVMGLSTAPMFDAIPIVFQNVSIEYAPSMHGLSTQAPQGSIIQIVGPHDSGKGSILKKIGDLVPTSAGRVMISPHLMVLQVPHEPLFIEKAGLLGNLSLARHLESAQDLGDADRGRRILRRLGLDKDWIMDLYDAEERAFIKKTQMLEDPAKDSPFGACFSGDEEGEEDEEEEDPTPTWAQQLSGSEKWRFQLARAFVHDPHVLLVHRPADELDPAMQDTVLNCFRDFVDRRGLEISENIGGQLPQGKRRPRTVIFTTGGATQIKIADYVWRVGSGGVSVEKSARLAPGPSWPGSGALVSRH